MDVCSPKKYFHFFTVISSKIIFTTFTHAEIINVYAVVLNNLLKIIRNKYKFNCVEIFLQSNWKLSISFSFKINKELKLALIERRLFLSRFQFLKSIINHKTIQVKLK